MIFSKSFLHVIAAPPSLTMHRSGLTRLGCSDRCCSITVLVGLLRALCLLAFFIKDALFALLRALRVLPFNEDAPFTGIPACCKIIKWTPNLGGDADPRGQCSAHEEAREELKPRAFQFREIRFDSIRYDMLNFLWRRRERAREMENKRF